MKMPLKANYIPHMKYAPFFLLRRHFDTEQPQVQKIRDLRAIVNSSRFETLSTLSYLSNRPRGADRRRRFFTPMPSLPRGRAVGARNSAEVT